MAEKKEYTNTRLDVLKLRLQGKQPRQIADTLGIRLVTVHTYIREIELQAANKNLADLSEAGMNNLKGVIGDLMPYMGKALEDTAKRVKQLNNLHGDVIEAGELTMHCIKILLDIEVQKDVPSLVTVAKITDLVDKINKSFFNKEGIQVVQVLNDNSVNVQNQEREKSLDVLKSLVGGMPVQDAELDDDVAVIEEAGEEEGGLPRANIDDFPTV